jgi:fluoroacetyl-CoA thioesterase
MAAFEIGMTGEVSRVVTNEDTAAYVASGLVEAFSTPALVALMENASVAAIQPHLREGETAVGIEVAIKHLAATPVGMRVRARAKLVEVDGRRLKFEVDAWDDKEQIGEGYHVRAIVDAARFNDRLKRKSPSST